MAVKGRKRKEGKRHPGGRLVQMRDHGCDGVIRRRAMYQRRTYIHDGDGKLIDVKVDDTQTQDAIGRAWSAGLLENDERDAAVLRDQGRELYALYWTFYGLGRPQDTLSRYSPGRSSSSREAQAARERAASTLKEQPESAREQNIRVMLHSVNTKLMVERSPHRWIAPNGNWQMVDVVSKYGAIPKYRCNGAGGVEEAWFDRKTREWRWPNGEAIHLPAKPISRAETDRLNAECARMGIRERFNYDGTTYQEGL